MLLCVRTYVCLSIRMDDVAFCLSCLSPFRRPLCSRPAAVWKLVLLPPSLPPSLPCTSGLRATICFSPCPSSRVPSVPPAIVARSSSPRLAFSLSLFLTLTVSCVNFAPPGRREKKVCFVYALPPVRCRYHLSSHALVQPSVPPCPFSLGPPDGRKSLAKRWTYDKKSRETEGQR